MAPGAFAAQGSDVLAHPFDSDYGWTPPVEKHARDTPWHHRYTGDDDPRDWNEGRLAAWLSSRGLPAEIVRAFETHLVNGLLGADIQGDDFAIMGITDPLHQRRVQVELRQLFCKGRQAEGAGTAERLQERPPPLPPSMHEQLDSTQLLSNREGSMATLSAQTSSMGTISAPARNGFFAGTPKPRRQRPWSARSHIGGAGVVAPPRPSPSSPYINAVPQARRARPRSAQAVLSARDTDALDYTASTATSGPNASVASAPAPAGAGVAAVAALRTEALSHNTSEKFPGSHTKDVRGVVEEETTIKAKRYLDGHKVGQVIHDMVQFLLRDQPQDPFPTMLNFLQEASGGGVVATVGASAAAAATSARPSPPLSAAAPPATPRPRPLQQRRVVQTATPRAPSPPGFERYERESRFATKLLQASPQASVASASSGAAVPPAAASAAVPSQPRQVQQLLAETQDMKVQLADLTTERDTLRDELRAALQRCAALQSQASIVQDAEAEWRHEREILQAELVELRQRCSSLLAEMKQAREGEDVARKAYQEICQSSAAATCAAYRELAAAQARAEELEKKRPHLEQELLEFLSQRQAREQIVSGTVDGARRTLGKSENEQQCQTDGRATRSAPEAAPEMPILTGVAELDPILAPFQRWPTNDFPAEEVQTSRGTILQAAYKLAAMRAAEDEPAQPHAPAAPVSPMPSSPNLLNAAAIQEVSSALAASPARTSDARSASVGQLDDLCKEFRLQVRDMVLSEQTWQTSHCRDETVISRGHESPHGDNVGDVVQAAVAETVAEIASAVMVAVAGDADASVDAVSRCVTGV